VQLSANAIAGDATLNAGGRRLAVCTSTRRQGVTCRPVVQTLLGHSSIVMTLDVYGHLFRDGGDRTDLAEASRLLGWRE
jgi:integrase